jgi:hypothetical protein
LFFLNLSRQNNQKEYQCTPGSSYHKKRKFLDELPLKAEAIKVAATEVKAVIPKIDGRKADQEQGKQSYHFIPCSLGLRHTTLCLLVALPFAQVLGFAAFFV